MDGVETVILKGKEWAYVDNIDGIKKPQNILISKIKGEKRAKKLKKLLKKKVVLLSGDELITLDSRYVDFDMFISNVRKIKITAGFVYDGWLLAKHNIANNDKFFDIEFEGIIN